MHAGATAPSEQTRQHQELRVQEAPAAQSGCDAEAAAVDMQIDVQPEADMHKAHAAKQSSHLLQSPIAQAGGMAEGEMATVPASAEQQPAAKTTHEDADMHPSLHLPQGDSNASGAGVQVRRTVCCKVVCGDAHY